MKNLLKIFKMTHLMNKEYNYDKLKKKNCKKYRRRILEKGMSENVSTFLDDSRKVLDCRSIALLNILVHGPRYLEKKTVYHVKSTASHDVSCRRNGEAQKNSYINTTQSIAPR